MSYLIVCTPRWSWCSFITFRNSQLHLQHCQNTAQRSEYNWPKIVPHFILWNICDTEKCYIKTVGRPLHFVAHMNNLQSKSVRSLYTKCFKQTHKKNVASPPVRTKVQSPKYYTNFHGISYWGSTDVISHSFTFVSTQSGELPALNVLPKPKSMMMITIIMMMIVIIIITIIISSSISNWGQAIQARSVFMGVGLWSSKNL